MSSNNESSEMVLPDEKPASENTEKQNKDRPKATNQRSRSGRTLIIISIIFIVLLLAMWLVFGGNNDLNSTSSEDASSKLVNAPPGDFADSRLQDALARQLQKDENEKLKDDVRKGKTVINLKDTDAASLKSLDDAVFDSFPEKKETNLFAGVERDVAEARERNAQLNQARARNSGTGFSSRQQVPTESGRARSANNNPPPPPVDTYAQPVSFEITAEDQIAEQRNASFARAFQNLKSQSDFDSDLPPMPVYHASSQTELGKLREQARMEMPEWEDDAQKEEPNRVLVMQNAGDLGIAWLEGLVDSDVPSAMVVAEILEGPLRGGRILGSHAIEGECILVDFNRLQWKGREVQIRAAAADETTGQTCVSGKINRRLTQRYAVPILFSIARVGQQYQAQKDLQVSTIDNQTGSYTTTTQGGQNFDTVAKHMAIDGTMDAMQNPVNRLANMPIQVKKDQGIIGVRWLERVEIDMSIKK